MWPCNEQGKHAQQLKQSFWLKSGFFSLLEKGSALLLSLGSVWMLFRLLDKEVLGTWALFLTLTAILEVGRIGLIQNGMVKFLAPAQGHVYAQVLHASAALHLLLAAGMALLLWMGASPLGAILGLPDLAPLLRIYALTTLCLTLFYHFNFVQQARLAFQGIFFSSFTRQLAFLLVVGWYWCRGEVPTLQVLAWTQLGAAGVASIVAWSMARPFLQRPAWPEHHWMMRLLAFGKYTLGTNLSTMLYRSIDKLMLGVLPTAGTAGVALYEAAIKINNLADVPTHSMASLVFPQSAIRIGEGAAAVGQLYEKAVGAILAVLAPIVGAIWLAAPWCIQLIAGPHYEASIPILRLTILYALFLPFAVQFGTVMDAIGKQRLNFYLTLLGATLNTAFNYLFISRWGVIGAAWGTLLTYAALFALMQWQLRRLLQVRWWRCFGYSLVFAKNAMRWTQQTLATEKKK